MDSEYLRYFINTGAAQGWQCPVCRRILSPWTQECPCKGEPKWGKSVTDNETYKITMGRIPANEPIPDHLKSTYTYKELLKKRFLEEEPKYERSE